LSSLRHSRIGKILRIPRPPGGKQPIYEFGPFRLDSAARLLFRDQEHLAITPKVLETLLFLVENAGRVVTKDELMAALWPDTVVEESNLTQSIFTLRRTLGESAADHRYVATVPGQGYTFVAPVRQVAPPQTAPAPVRPTPAARSTPRWVWPVIFTLAAATVVAGVTLLRRTSPTQGGQPVPFTSLRGGEYEPAFSPDGTQIAFVWNGEREEDYDIYVSPVESLAPRRLTAYRGGEGSPAWSPDGSRIAFLRYAGAPRETGAYVVPVGGGAEVRITGCLPLAHIFDRHLDWSPDGKYLALVDKSAANQIFGIWLVTIETGERRRLTTPPAQSLGDTGPVFSPDGQTLAFRRTSSANANDLYVIPVSGGEARQVTSDRRFTTNHAFAADGKELVFSSNRGGTPSLWRIAVSGGEPRPTLPHVQGAYFLAISRNNSLAYSQISSDADIWRLDLDAEQASQAVRVVSSTRQDTSPQYSPDGRRIAFRSDRSGSDEIWVCDASGANPVQLTSFGGPLTGTPRWSPDGLRLAFDSRPAGHSDIYTVSTAGGALRRITSEESEDVVPSWSGDADWIYFASNRSGSWQVWKAPAAGGTALPVTRHGGFAALEDPSGGVLYYAKGHDQPGLWRVPVRGGEEALAVPELQRGHWGYWGITEEGVYYINPDAPSGAELHMFQFSSGQFSVLARLGIRPKFGDAGFSVTPDGTSVLYTRIEREGSDIMLVRNFR